MSIFLPFLSEKTTSDVVVELIEVCKNNCKESLQLSNKLNLKA